MSHWFRDYVFIPIAVKGNEMKIGLSLFLTMALAGLWHGAAWNYIIWGGLWGGALVIYRYCHKYTRLRLFSLNPLLGIFLTYHLWLFLLMIFITPSLSHGFKRLIIIATDFSISHHAWNDLCGIFIYAWPLVIVQCIQYFRNDIHIMKRLSTSTSALLYTFILCALLFNGADLDQEFIYFQF